MIAPIVLRTALFLTLLFCSTSALAQVQFIPSDDAQAELISPVNFGREKLRDRAMPWLKPFSTQSFSGSANSTSTFSFESGANTGTLSSTPGFPLSIIPSRHGFSRFSEPSLFFFMKSLVMSLPCASGPMTALDHPDKPPPAPSPITDNDVKLLSDCHGPAPDFTFTGTALTSADLDDALVGGGNNGHTAGSNGAVALWANADDGPDKLTFTLGGSFNIVDGLIVSRGHMQIGGSWNLLRHGTEYGIRNVSEPAFDLSGSDNCFSPKPDQVDRDALLTAPTGFPFASSFDPDEDGLVLEHFEPGSAAALAAMADSTPGPQYFVCGVPDPDGVADGAAVSSFCVGNSIVIGVQGTIIPTGLYYIPGTILINASNLEAVITMVAGEEIDVSGSVQGAENIFSPYVNPLLFASQHDVNDNNADGNPDPPATANTSDAEDAIETAGSFALFKGIIVATNGATTLDGQHNRFTCPVMGDRIRLKGSNNYFDVAACGERASVVTEIHAGNDHTTDIQGDTVDLGTSIHDKVTVSSNTDPQAPLTGTITVRQWNDGTCGIDGGVVQQTACFDEAGNPVAGCTTGTYASAVSVTIDNVLTFTPPVGVYSYKATYSGDPNNPGVADGLCEGPVTVVAPDLTPVKTNNVNDATVLGDPWVWTVTVSNQGAGNAHFLDGETVFTDNLPNPGGNSISYTGSGALTNPVGITGTINCARVGLNINCVASGPASIAAGGSFQVAVTATPLLTGSYTNPDGICRVDPTGHPPGNVPETDETNNNCSNTVNVTGPDLTPVKTNNVNDATVLGDPWVWTVTVNNNGTGAANFLNGETVFTDNLPNPGGISITYSGFTGLTNPVGITGTITCTLVSLNINCVASGPASIAAGGSFKVAVTATPQFTGTYTNPDGICRVDPTGHPPGNVPETNETNNDCSDSVTVNPRTPSLITTPNPPNGSVGTTLNDSGTLSGGFLPTGSITFRLFRPIDSTCTGTAAFTNVVPVNGNGVYNTTQGFVADVTGIWHWTAVYSGDVNNLGATSGCAAEPVNIGGPGATLLIIDEEGFDNGLHYHPDADFPPGGTIIPSGPSFFDIFEVNDDKPARNQRDVLQYFLDHPGDTITVRTGQVGDEGWFAPTCIPNRWLQGSNSKINNDCLSGADRATALNNFFGNNGEGAVPGFKDLPGEKDEEFRLDKIRAVMPLRALGLKELEGKNVCAVVYDSNISINYVSNSFPFTHGNLMGETLGIAAFKVELVRTLNGFSSSTLPEVVITILNAQTTCGTFELFNAPVPRSSSIPFDINGETPINHTNKNGYRRLKVFADLGLFF